MTSEMAKQTRESDPGTIYQHPLNLWDDSFCIGPEESEPVGVQISASELLATFWELRYLMLRFLLNGAVCHKCTGGRRPREKGK